ncbi:Putative electron transport protein YccM [archaeon HR06]|nr:Putative electron transport protein YccM [archaeon HR06]
MKLTEFKKDLLQFNLLRRLVKHRAFQFSIILPNLFIFWLIILAGFFGSPVGNMNISITFVWMLWWAALIMILVPFFSRLWCTMCPIPAFGEWLQRKGFIRKGENYKPKGKNWPIKFRNIWLQNFGFLTIATFSVLLVTRPLVTAIVLSLLFILATIFAFFYTKRAFCRYLCPVGGFLGIFSMFSSLELRVKNRELCLNHLGKECIKGCENSFGCPWFEYPGNMERNNFCGLCFECVKACPFNNIALRVRSFGKDILVKAGRSIDEAWKVFIMLTLSILYIIVMQGPWGWLKDFANVFYEPNYNFALKGVEGFILYAGIFWSSSLALTPAIFLTFSYISKLLSKAKSLKKIFIDFSYELIPLALTAWIAFSIPIILVNWSYIINTISDPFGFGWDIFGTKSIEWNPILPEIIPYLQTIVLAIGLLYSINFGFKIAFQNFGDKKVALLAFLPQFTFLIGSSLLLLWLFLG